MTSPAITERPIVQPAQARAGWYQDPYSADAKDRRYWDGSQWTVVAAKHKTNLTGPIVLAVVVPIVGAIWGLIIVTRDEVGPGMAVIGVSVISFLFWSLVVLSNPSLYS